MTFLSQDFFLIVNLIQLELPNDFAKYEDHFQLVLIFIFECVLTTTTKC